MFFSDFRHNISLTPSRTEMSKTERTMKRGKFFFYLKEERGTVLYQLTLIRNHEIFNKAVKEN